MDFIFYFLRLIFCSSCPGGVLSGCSELAPFSGIPHLLSTHCSLIKKQSSEKNFHYKVRARLNTSISSFFLSIVPKPSGGKVRKQKPKEEKHIVKREQLHCGCSLYWRQIRMTKMCHISRINVKLHLVSLAHCKS